MVPIVAVQVLTEIAGAVPLTVEGRGVGVQVQPPLAEGLETAVGTLVAPDARVVRVLTALHRDTVRAAEGMCKRGVVEPRPCLAYERPGVGHGPQQRLSVVVVGEYVDDVRLLRW